MSHVDMDPCLNADGGPYHNVDGEPYLHIPGTMTAGGKRSSGTSASLQVDGSGSDAFLNDQINGCDVGYFLDENQSNRSVHIELQRATSNVNPLNTRPYLDMTDFELIDANAINVSRLKHASSASALLSGFAMIAFVEINFEPDTPQWLMITFGIVTATLISVHLWALLVSTCLLPNLDSYNKFLIRRQRAVGSTNYNDNSNPELSPHRKFRHYIILAWFFSTGVGIVLILAEVIVVAWMRFIKISPATGWSVTVIVAPLIVLFTLFARHFHNNVIKLQLAVHHQALTHGLQDVTPRNMV
eukprot:CFRG0243T1